MSRWLGRVVGVYREAYEPNGSFQSNVASGVWDVSESLYFQSQGKWPLRGDIPIGQDLLTAAGNVTWTAPQFVTRISVVCVGAGGTGGGRGPGGGGGALGWRNDIPVEPDTSYPIQVGYPVPAGSYASTSVGGAPYQASVAFGVYAAGGTGSTSPSTINGYILGGNVSGTYGGGGDGGDTPTGGRNGGGAGGYSGKGGTGNLGSPGSDAPVGSGAGAGGTGGSVQGGGVGVLGQGPDGVAAGPREGSYGSGITYGGGGRGNPNSNSALLGGPGAVRIIYGVGRFFPDNATGNLTPYP